jgi:uncharacterized membrane protein YvlD (DUF360 family)
MKTLIELIVSLLIVFGVFTAVVGAMALMINGLDYLPQYIGGFGTFMLYLSIFTLIFCILYNYKNKTK